MGRLQDHGPVQLARAGHRSDPDRLHQRAPRADAVLQRDAARALQRPHSFDLEGAGDEHLRHDRRGPDLHDPGEQQPRGFRRRFRDPHRRQYGAAVPDRLCRRHRRRQCARLLAAGARGLPAAQQRHRRRRTARLSPPFLPGFAGSTSAYYTPNTTPRGAYADTGMLLGRSSLTMFDTEFRYRMPTPGWRRGANTST